MRRAVFDPNVFISALLSSQGTSAALLKAWLQGEFELVISEKVIGELERVFAYPKIRSNIPLKESREFIDLLRRGQVAEDPAGQPPVKSPDPADDYLIALASTEHCALVTGDGHLLGLKEQIPVYSPREFWDVITTSPG